AVVLASTVISLTLGETALQITYRVENGRWLPSDVLGFRVGYTAPVIDRREFALRAGFRDATTTINAYGFRGRAVPPGAPAVVAVLGESVPVGYVTSDDDTYPDLLDRLFRDHHRAERVVNAGVPSYNFRQALDRYRIDVRPRYKPEVVVLQAANDISLLTEYRERWTPDVTWATMR